MLMKKEIPGFVATRLQEALWREALWLVNDGIATTEEIDDAIRMGFGLRWGQMGLFETYRVAGGPAGIAHFISQFGPALEWEWTGDQEDEKESQEFLSKAFAGALALMFAYGAVSNPDSSGVLALCGMMTLLLIVVEWMLYKTIQRSRALATGLARSAC